jgi:hypothetical protein
MLRQDLDGVPPRETVWPGRRALLFEISVVPVSVTANGGLRGQRQV